MTASAGAWYRVGTVNVTKNNQIVTGVATNWQNDVIAIAVGDIFTLDAKTWYEVTAVASDTSITLDRGFEGATGTGKAYAIVRNTSGTILTRIAGQVSVQFNQKQLFLDELRTWLNSNSASETLTDSHGITQSLKTPSQMVRDHDNRLAELDEIHPFPWAMRKVEFEARRAVNNEMFAASGFVYFGKQTTLSENVGEGLSSVESQHWVNQFRLGVSPVSNNIFGKSVTHFPKLNIGGVVTNLRQIGRAAHETDNNSVRLPPAEDGTRTYDSATGLSVTHATPEIAFASETATNKVVTDRVDMWGFEAYLREVKDDDPFVYANGLIQSLAGDINGVATFVDTSRPETYFSWFEGDAPIRGRGVNWQTASEANRIKIASDPANNIYFDDATGKFYQWCVRGRSFAGAGNGDWRTSRPQKADTLGFAQHLATTVQIQGSRGALEPPAWATTYVGREHTSNKNPFLGVFTNVNHGIPEDNYFLVCGSVNRLNQGAYHPSFNPSGTAKWGGGTLDEYNLAYRYDWREIGSLPSLGMVATTRQQAFTLKSTAQQGSGSIGSEPARPDGRNHDTIYASGHGGLCRDMRYSAWGLTQEDFVEADLNVKSGKYRGRENLARTKVDKLEVISDGFSGAVPNYLYQDSRLRNIGVNMASGETLDYYLVNSATKEVIHSDDIPPAAHDVSRSKSIYYPAAWGDTPTIYVIHRTPEASSIAGEFSHAEVIGTPSNILLCKDLKSGWLGSWHPILPDGVSQPRKLSRKAKDVTKVYRTTDLGVTWTGHTISSLAVFSERENTVSFPSLSADYILMLMYTTKARMTEGASNSPVYGGEKGVGVVHATAFTQGDNNYQSSSDFCYSLISKVTDRYTVAAYPENQKTLSLSINTDKRLTDAKEAITTHTPINLSIIPENPAVKALNYNVLNNQQGFVNYAYTELKAEALGAGVGDDNQIHIVDGKSTRLDDNGAKVIYGTAQIVEPLGWIKNDK
ncbi:hypothetical protein PTRA_a1466 [Pseudoalteromonas translucida KMM 520]|uniref:Tail fiber protein n=1 Tax=Pseudoalteromonas translucida KMM 520 TaxID=1315283 RepID=A0A0U2VGS7_9GAMM|nr:hypothetical protein [Pseudoalteromonas translucida]ALS32677.1 hypothetical protein PTRA_a1466 [Pseudoalteromonas translucida KMM 520]